MASPANFDGCKIKITSGKSIVWDVLNGRQRAEINNYGNHNGKAAQQSQSVNKWAGITIKNKEAIKNAQQKKIQKKIQKRDSQNLQLWVRAVMRRNKIKAYQ